jgi:hypothetical protein
MAQPDLTGYSQVGGAGIASVASHLRLPRSRACWRCVRKRYVTIWSEAVKRSTSPDAQSANRAKALQSVLDADGQVRLEHAGIQRRTFAFDAR